MCGADTEDDEENIDMDLHEGLPVKGYQRQSDANVSLVNSNKETEERILRLLDKLQYTGDCDPRWLAIARSHFEQGYMALNRSIFKPQRIELPEDAQLDEDEVPF